MVWKGGKAVAPAGPSLYLSAGDGRVRVPFMKYSQAYKYLGRATRADGDDSAAWSALKKSLAGALRRLRKVRPGALSREEFELVAESLLGGICGFLARSFSAPLWEFC